MAFGTLKSSVCSTARRTAAPLLPPRHMTAPLAAASAATTAAAAAVPVAAAAAPAAAAAAAAATKRRHHPRRPARAAAAAAAADVAPAATTISAVGAPSCRLVKDVAVAVQRTSMSSRVLVAAVDIAAPPSAVWAALTDYERLADFIPSLETNECLAHDPQEGTARLRQVGAQDVAMGMKFRAAVTVDIREHRQPGGIPAELVTTSLDSRDYLGEGARFPAPVAAPGEDEADDAALVEAARAAAAAAGEAEASDGGGSGSSSPSSSSSSCSWPRDISFELVEGDFSAFRGVWRVNQGPAGPLTARLSYAVFVQPQAFLPVGLIQGRISRDVATNLKSVRAHAEEVVFERLMRQQTAAAEAEAATIAV